MMKLKKNVGKKDTVKKLFLVTALVSTVFVGTPVVQAKDTTTSTLKEEVGKLPEYSFANSISIQGVSSVLPGGSTTLTAVITPEDALVKEVSWSIVSGNATIDANGVLTVGNEEGVVEVKATALDGSGLSETKQIAVLDPTAYQEEDKARANIKKDEFTVNPTIADFIYGETPSVPNLGTTKSGNAPYVYGYTDSLITAGKWALGIGKGTELPANPDAGLWYLVVRTDPGNGYRSASYVVTFTIEKAASTIKINENIFKLSKFYDGQPAMTPTTTVTGTQGEVTNLWLNYGDVLPDLTNMSIKELIDFLLNLGNMTKAPTDAGVYSVFSIAFGDKNYKSASTSKTFVILPSLNYWTKPLPLIIKGCKVGETPTIPNAESKFGEVTYTYSDKINGVYGELPQSLHAGTWYVKASVQGTKNYNALVDIRAFVVTKNVSTIDITNSLDKVYDGNPVIDPEIVVTGSQKEANIEYYKVTLTGIKKLDSKPTDTGAYLVNANVAGDDNYYGATTTKGFIIAYSLNNRWTEELSIEDWTYGEPANLPSATSTFGEVTYSYSDKLTGKYGALPENPHAGTWYVKANVKTTSNYNGLVDVKSFQIHKADSSIEIADLDKVYDGKAVVADATKTGSSKKLKYTWYQKTETNEISLDEEWTKLKEAPKNAGTYRLVATLGADKNYNGAIAIKDFTIAQATNTWSTTPSIDGWVYRDANKTPAAKATFGTAVVTYSDTIDGEYGQLPTNPHAGNWFMKVEVAGSENYTSLTKVVAFEIDRRDVTAPGYQGLVVPEINKDTKLDSIVITDLGVVLVQGTDFEIVETKDGDKVNVTINFIGNYKGSLTRTYTVKKQNVPTGDTTTLSTLMFALIVTTGAILVVNKKRKENLN